MNVPRFSISSNSYARPGISHLLLKGIRHVRNSSKARPVRYGVPGSPLDAIARHLVSLSTLRGGGLPTAARGSLPAAGPALPGGIDYPQDSRRKVSSLRLSPFLELLGAMSVQFHPSRRAAISTLPGQKEKRHRSFL